MSTLIVQDKPFDEEDVMVSTGTEGDAREPAEEDIRTRAYQLWLAAGSPDGNAEQYWQEARQQLMAARPANEDQSEAGTAE
jgi:hypothetical protein